MDFQWASGTLLTPLFFLPRSHRTQRVRWKIHICSQYLQTHSFLREPRNIRIFRDEYKSRTAFRWKKKNCELSGYFGNFLKCFPIFLVNFGLSRMIKSISGYQYRNLDIRNEQCVRNNLDHVCGKNHIFFVPHSQELLWICVARKKNEKRGRGATLTLHMQMRNILSGPGSILLVI